MLIIIGLIVLFDVTNFSKKKISIFIAAITHVQHQTWEVQRQITGESLLLLQLIFMFCGIKVNDFLLCMLFHVHSVCFICFITEIFLNPHASM